MSFILDALKKSDAERQKRSTPGFADIPVSRDRRPPPRWLWVLGGLLGVNLVAVIVLLVRPEAAPPADPVPAGQETAAPVREARRPFADVVAEARQKAEQAPAPAQNEDRRAELSADARNTPAPAAQRPAGAGAAPAAGDAGNDRQVTVPENTFESLRADGTLSLPDLHLDIHVYSEQSAERFVFINMKKYRENETLTEGPAVRHIAPEGVVLEHRGTAFLLPRE